MHCRLARPRLPPEKSRAKNSGRATAKPWRSRGRGAMSGTLGPTRRGWPGHGDGEHRHVLQDVDPHVHRRVFSAPRDQSPMESRNHPPWPTAKMKTCFEPPGNNILLSPAPTLSKPIRQPTPLYCYDAFLSLSTHDTAESVVRMYRKVSGK